MTPGTLPQSTALAEARADSLSELLSRDPESYQTQDLDRIIEVLREQRRRWQAAEASGAPRRGQSKTSSEPGTRATDLSMDDLGL